MANASLQIGNGNWAIKENDLLGYSKSGTRFLPIPITMTRATLGSRVNPSGLVENVELLGSELITNGDFSSSDLSSFTVIFATQEIVSQELKTTLNTSNGYGFTRVFFTAEIGKSYRILVDAKQGTSDGTQIKTQSGLTLTQSSSTTGDWSFYGIGVATSTSCEFRLQVNGSDGDFGFFDNVSVKEVTRDGLARVDYTDGTASLLVEPQRTNLFTYSEDFSQFPISNRLVITPNNITSPDGTINASKMQQTDGVTTAPNIAFSNVSAGAYTVSAFAKKGTRSFLVISFNGTSYFDLQNGTITTTGTGHTASIENFGNDWYRCSIVKTISTTQTAAFYFADTNNTLTTSDDEGYMYLYGTQLEVGSYPTSYIKTQGSTVTRNKDQYTKTGISDKINSEEGVLFVEMAALSNSGNFRYISLINDANNFIQIYFKDSNNFIAALVKSSGVTSFFANHNVGTATNYSKIAIKFKQDDFALWVNGVEVATDTSGNVPSSLSQLALDFNGGNNFEGKVRQLQVFKTALSDSELATLTT